MTNGGNSINAEGAVPGIIGSVLAKVPAASEAVLRAVGLRLVGKLIEWPEAWVDSKVQSLRDLTAARSEIAKAAVKEAISQGSKSPELWGATTELLLGDWERKLSNKLSVYKVALEHVSKENNRSSEDVLKVPEDDWINSFVRYAEDASSEKLQDLYARILAGEIRSNGSFSIATLRVMSELTQNIADRFSSVHSDSIDGYLVLNEKYKSGKSFSDLNMLTDAGFISSVDMHIISKVSNVAVDGTKYFTMTFGISPTLVAVFKREKKGLMDLPFEPSLSVRKYTEMGQQIASLLPTPNYEQNIRAAASEFAADDELEKIEIRFADGKIETITDRSAV